MTSSPTPDHDVLVIGGGPAGLAGALSLVRARRSVLVVDAGEPRNAPAGGVHNFLTRDGTPPAELTAIARAEVASYGAGLLDARAVAARPWDGPGTGFAVAIDDGGDGTREVTARRLLVTTGLVDRLPDVDGLAERWGRDVVHCPYCHGYEVRDQRIVVLGTTAMAGHAGLLWRQWSDDVTILLDPSVPAPTGEEAERLAARDVRVVTGRAAGLVVGDDALSGVRLADGPGTGRVLHAQVLVAAGPMVARSELLEQLGAATVPLEAGGVRFGTRVEVSPTGATSVPGVYAAGNVTDLVAQVVTSAAGGAWAGAQLNMELVVEDADLARAGRPGHGTSQPAR